MTPICMEQSISLSVSLKLLLIYGRNGNLYYGRNNKPQNYLREYGAARLVHVQ